MSKYKWHFFIIKKYWIIVYNYTFSLDRSAVLNYNLENRTEMKKSRQGSVLKFELSGGIIP